MSRVCRICLEIIVDDLQFFILNTIKPDPDSICIKSKLEACIPEITLSMVEKSFICNHCSLALSAAYEFRTKCLQTEERLYNYMLETKSDFDSIDLYLIVKKELKFIDKHNEDVNTTTEAPLEETSSSSESKYAPGCFEECYTIGAPDSLTIKTEDCGVEHYNVVDTNNKECENDITNNENIDFIKSGKQNVAREKRYKCNVCGYSSNKSIKSHMMIHTGEKIFKHLIRVQKPFQCPNCEYSGGTKSHLTRHMSIHTGLKPYKCTVCKFSTAYKNNLKDHMSIHDGYKPYKCARCEFSTSTKQHLGKHMRIHTGDRPYKCTICGFSSAYHSSLKKHLGIHNGVKPFKCPDCKYSTTSKGRLKEHQADIHLGTRPYKCEKCDYSTARKGSYIQHMKLHSGTKKRIYKVYSNS